MITGTLGLFNATLAGFDTASKMAALSAFSGIQKSRDSTAIQKLTTNVRVTPEGIHSTDLELVMPAIGQLNGGGTISSSSALNLKTVATLNTQSGLASAVGSITGRGSNNARIPFMVQGTTSDPKFVPDVGGMVGGAIESELEKAVGSDPRTKGLSDALARGALNGQEKEEQIVLLEARLAGPQIVTGVTWQSIRTPCIDVSRYFNRPALLFLHHSCNPTSPGINFLDGQEEGVESQCRRVRVCGSIDHKC